MRLFGRKDEDFEDRDEDELDIRSSSPRKFRDLKPENRRRRKEPIKPWGEGERILVLAVFLVTVLSSAILAASARSWKLPGFPPLSFPGFPSLPSFNFFGEEVIEIGGKRPDDKRNREKAEAITQSFKNETKNLSGIYALYVIDLTSGFSFGVGEKTVMQAASLIKLPVMASLYKEKPEGYRKLSEAMGKRSDNGAFNKSLKILGEEKIKQVIAEIGMTKTTVSENETTPYDIGLFFAKLYKGEILPQPAAEEILASLTDTIYEEHLVVGVPDGVRVSHKYGLEIHVVNDAGIVFSQKPSGPGGPLGLRPYIVVIMTKGIVEKEANEIFPTLSRLVYEGMTGN